jgi:p-aminobenzoyl-glutamate transporter AbgT
MWPDVMSSEINTDEKKSNENFTGTNSNDAKRPFFLRMLDYVEIIGNKLPHPATLFAGLALLVVIISWIGYMTGTSAQHPGWR